MAVRSTVYNAFKGNTRSRFFSAGCFAEYMTAMMKVQEPSVRHTCNQSTETVVPFTGQPCRAWVSIRYGAAKADLCKTVNLQKALIDEKRLHLWYAEKDVFLGTQLIM